VIALYYCSDSIVLPLGDSIVALY